MSTLRVNNIESYTSGNPLNVNDELQMTGSTATGNKSVAFGDENTAEASYSSVLGGLYNIAQGANTAILGGTSNKVSGSYSTAAGGSLNKVTGSRAVAMGNSNTIEANSDYSVAAGNANTLQSTYNWSHGWLNTVKAQYAGAVGRSGQISSSAEYGVSFGHGIHLSNPYQVGVGRFNVEGGLQDEGSVFVIGNGTSTSSSGRSNLIDFRSGSVGFVLDTDSIPTSAVGLPTGALYRTGSNLDEIRIKL